MLVHKICQEEMPKDMDVLLPPVYSYRTWQLQKQPIEIDVKNTTNKEKKKM